MNSFITLTALLGLQSLGSAHMLLSYPPAFRYEHNPNVNPSLVDSNLVAPLKADGSDFPCKGYQSDLGTAAGASVASWATGGTYNFTIAGGAPHNGGSCQAALSYDKGKTFTVLHSYIGGCPTTSPAGGSFSFTLPADATPGAALFAWTWFNQVGNREMYMDCASVTITGPASKKRASVPFTSRPSLFVANLGNGCTTTETTDLKFPDPGPDVTDVTKTPGGFTGTCKAVAGIGDFSSASGSSPSSLVGNATQASSSLSVSASSSINTGAGTTASAANGFATQVSSGFQTVVTSSTPVASSFATQASSGFQTVTASAPATSPTATSSQGQSPDGSCGASSGFTCTHGNCCSQAGWCGSSDLHCGTGCQSAFGTCKTTNNSSTTLQISSDKTCGGATSNTCQGSSFGNCCSQYGYCGNTTEYCGTGCQAGFGTCGQSSSGASSSSPSGASSTSQFGMSSAIQSARSSSSPSGASSTSKSEMLSASQYGIPSASQSGISSSTPSGASTGQFGMPSASQSGMLSSSSSSYTVSHFQYTLPAITQTLTKTAKVTTLVTVISTTATTATISTASSDTIGFVVHPTTIRLR